MDGPGTDLAKPRRRPTSHFGPTDRPLHLEGSWIWAPLRADWLVRKPEELVRQQFIYRLQSQWGFSLDQMRQEVKTQAGRSASKADIIVAESVQAAKENRGWKIVVETKAENVTIKPEDYAQGESYARAIGAEFLVMHNHKETSFCRLVPGAPGERIEITGIPGPGDFDDARRLQEIRTATKAFTRDEFQRLLYDCHCILRDNHKMDPGAAFDEISRILFIKMAFERQGNSEVFTTERLREHARISLLDQDDPTVLNQMFDVTKKFYKADKLFSDADDIKVSLPTFKRIVKKLEKFNLSDTGDDIKGIAFEKFLGQTFRGELGQFFTPRPIVDFMVDMLAPVEGDLICDPACGTGGFLIKAFESIRAEIEADVQRRKIRMANELEQRAVAENWDEDDLVDELEKLHAELNRSIDVSNSGSRAYALAHRCIFGMDAEPRAARTSKMNMIMHGDGHGGLYYRDGLLDFGGVFEGRFDVVITNPPFGASVGRDQIVGSTEQTSIDDDFDRIRDCKRAYGDEYEHAHARLLEALRNRRPILELFEIGRDPIAGEMGRSKVRPNRSTEVLFIERCIRLLKPGGRMAIVVPDGVLNNPSLGWLRSYVEGRARLLAVISLPQEVFTSSKATVKTSILFLQRFSLEDEKAWKEACSRGQGQAEAEAGDQRAEVAELHSRADKYDRDDLLPIFDEIKRAESRRPVNQAEVGRAKKKLRELLTADDRMAQRRLRDEANRRAREVDSAVEQRQRELARTYFSYEVFMASVEKAGITSTGETGEHVDNELPDVLSAYRDFLQDPFAFARRIAQQLSGDVGEQEGQV